MRTITFLILLVISNGLFSQLEIPKYDADDTIIKHRGYTLSYNSKYKQANWVAYLLTRSSTGFRNRFERTNDFKADPLIPGTDFSLDYQKSGYDRGHLAPAADMGYSNETMIESFYYSNMTPQVPRFNRGVWEKLEKQVRSWANEYDSLYIVTGPIFDRSMMTIGPHRVAVPKAFYKVLLQKRKDRWFAVGFIILNANFSGNIMRFATSIDKVEESTGIDFFWEMKDEVEKIVESSIFDY